MSGTRAQRRIPNDWYEGGLPDNVELGADVLMETAFCFSLFRSERPDACSIGAATSVYLGTMFDTGRRGRITVGRYAILNGPRLVSDLEITVGDYALLAWGVVVMDSYRVPMDVPGRRRVLDELAARSERAPHDLGEARPIRIGSNVWIGFDSCVLPGVSIGEGSVIGARSVVTADVPPYCIAAGNPARVVRELERGGADA